MRFVFICLLLGLVAPGAVSAEPRVAVKARAHLVDVKTMSRGAHVIVRGALRDNLHQAVPHAKIVVEVGDHAQTTVKTTANGGFAARIPVTGQGQRMLKIRFAGDALLGPALLRRAVQVGRAEVHIALRVPHEVKAGHAVSAAVTLRDALGDPLPGLSIEPLVDRIPQTHLVTDPKGHARWQLPALAPGAHQLTVRWAGDDQRRPAAATVAVNATRPLTVSLKAAPRAEGATLYLEGAAQTGDDTPTNLVVILTLDGAPYLQRAPDRAGRFTAQIPPADLAPGRHTLRATASTDHPGWRDGVSQAITLEVAAQTARQTTGIWRWLAVGLAGTCLTLIALGAWRRRPPKRAPPSAAHVPPPLVFESGHTTSLRLWIGDALTGAALDAVAVRLPPDAAAPLPASSTPPAGPRVRTDAEGWLELPGEGARIWAWAPGYGPVFHTLPSAQGQVQLHLLPLRAELQALYAAVLAEAGAPALRFGHETPREAVAPLGQRGAPGPALTALTRAVERACFGATPPELDDLSQALDWAATVRRGLRRGAS